MGAWGIKALERDEGLDVLDILKNEYVPEHPVMDLGEMIELMKEEVMLGSDFSQIDFLFDNTAMALAELYFQWKDNGKLDYDHEEAIWDKVTGFTASKEALAFLLRQLTDIKNEVPDEDGIREIVDLWKNEDSGEIAPAWLEHLNQLIDRLDSEQEARQMYIKKYWGNFIGGSDDSLNLMAFLEDQKQEEIPLSEIFAKIGLDKQNWDFRQTVEYLEFTHSDGVEMQNSTNMRILELLRFLYERTDENHPATVSDIIAHLNGKGIQAVRQTVYADTNALIDAGIDIVVVKSTQNQYFMGNRLFEYPELKMLTDAVASSKIISAKKSEELVQKLFRLTSLHQAKQLQKFAALSSRVKPHNEKVYYIIDNIQTAIGNHQQIRFQYYEYTQEKKKILKHDGYYYVVNPYALEWKNDHYYLIGFSLKHQKIAHFRVDRLTSVENLETYFMPIEGFDVASYTNKMVDMFTSESSKEVTLLCENELMRVIIDHYGEDAAVDRYDDTHFTAKIEVNPSGTFYGWIFKFKGKIKILSPKECITEMQQIAQEFI